MCQKKGSQSSTLFFPLNILKMTLVKSGRGNNIFLKVKMLA